MYKVLLTQKVTKELEKIPKPANTHIVIALDELVKLGTSAANTKKLQTPFPGYRKRVGKYRILYEINEDIIIVYKISKRADVYR